jgi:hypothetical protein
MARYVWADKPAGAWGLVKLCDADDVREQLGKYVHGSQEEAERADADTRMGATLYRVERTAMLADENTPAPQGEDWVFTYSTEGAAHVWSKPNCYAPWADAKRFDGFWTFPDPREPIERAARANLEPRTVGYGEAFRVWLLTWSVDAVEEHQEARA